ncbi:MAG TPA: hypothetical protein VN937_30020 [Blastocatellia bacterium]|nr:hypothetical protein [Blastocatellia bacterium]
MKRPNPLILALVAVLMVLAGGFYWHSRRVQAVSVRISIKDLPEHGLELTGPSDPAFEGDLSALLKGKKNDIVEALKPFSVILRNRGNRAVVAYWLKWEMIKADGTIVTRQAGGSNPDALMDGGTRGSEHLSTSRGYAIRTKSKRFVSLGFSLGEDEDDGSIGAVAGGSENQNAVAQLQEAARDKDLSSMLDATNAELRGYESITVSIDGVFLEDGTFVGPDTTQFFARIEAVVDAKRDLLEEIRFRTNRNKSSQEIFGYVEELANGPDVVMQSHSTPTDHYNLYKKIYAQEILRMRQRLGDERAMAVALEPFRKQWPKLKKP